MPRRKSTTARAIAGRTRRARKPRQSAAASIAPADTSTPQENGVKALTETQLRALWFNHKPTIVGLREQITRTTGKLRAAYKALKSETGITRAEVEFALSLAEDTDNKILHSERRRRMLARWEQHPIGTQADLFDEQQGAKYDPLRAGKDAGLRGEVAKPPHGTGSVSYSKWMEGWHAGDEERRATLARVGRGTTPIETAAGSSAH